MNFFTVGALALALGTDAFSLAVGVGVAGIRLQRMIPMVLVVGAFHVLMPLAGIWAGQILGSVVGVWAGRIGALVLLVIGGRMIWESRKGEARSVPLGSGRSLLAEPARKPAAVQALHTGKQSMAMGLWSLIGLSASVSLDALGVGFSLGTLQFNILAAVLTLGAVAALMTLAGLLIGRRLGGVIGDKAELAGGAILALIGLKLLVF